MSMMVLDPFVAERLKTERAARGIDSYDEVWDGLYVVPPVIDNEHQDVLVGLGSALRHAFGWDAPVFIAPANVSDRERGWLFNYRCPDLVVVCPEGKAKDCDTHWYGGPDFCVEITSQGDWSRKKIDFYGSIGTRELLLVDRHPWKMELYRLGERRLELVESGDPATGSTLHSEVVPVRFRMIAGTPRPKIEVTHRDSTETWVV